MERCDSEESAVEMSGLTLAELHSKSFENILTARRHNEIDRQHHGAKES